MKRILIAVFVFLPVLTMAWAPHDNDDAPDSANYASPPGIGENGPFDAHNIELLGHLTIGEIGGGPSNILGADIWGWTDPVTGKEYALCCLMHATSFIDISDARDPKYLGRVMTHTGVSTWRDVKVYNNHAFIVSDFNGGHGIQIFDLTRLRDVDPDQPQDFSIDAHYSGVGSAHNIAINEDTGFAYVVGSSQAGGGLHAVNIQDPLNPVEAGNSVDGGYTHDATVITYNGPDAEYVGREIAFGCNISALVISDVTDKTDITFMDSCFYPDNGYCHQCWISEDHRYLYLGDEFDERDFDSKTRTLVFDCIDLDDPQYLGYYEGPTNAVDHNLIIKGNKIYLGNYAAGLRVLEIDPTDPLNLTEIGYFDTYPTDNDRDFDGAWAAYPFESGKIIINDRQNGLFIVRLAELQFDFPDGVPELISPEGQIEFTVAVSDGYGGTPSPNSGVLHVDQGSGFVEYPMVEVKPNVYEAKFPAIDCGRQVKFYVSATSTNGVEAHSPSLAPNGFYTTKVAASQEFTFQDDFENDLGWTVTDDLIEGRWERGVPIDTGAYFYAVEDADGSGSMYQTGIKPFVSVEEGSTTLTSPILDAVGDGTAVAAFVNYYRWYYNAVGNVSSSETMLVEISNDAGQTWVELETVGPGGHEVTGEWFYKSFRINDFLTPTDQIQIRFIASDINGSYVDAAIDGVEIQLLYCENEVLLGDVNLDGVVDLLDVDPFVQLLVEGDFQMEADINLDGVVDLLDVSFFVDLISGG